MPRYYITVWQENGEFCANDIAPIPVADTIKAAVANGLRHGTVIHQRTIRMVDGVFPELWCWQLR